MNRDFHYTYHISKFHIYTRSTYHNPQRAFQTPKYPHPRIKHSPPRLPTNSRFASISCSQPMHVRHLAARLMVGMRLRDVGRELNVGCRTGGWGVEHSRQDPHVLRAHEFPVSVPGFSSLKREYSVLCPQPCTPLQVPSFMHKSTPHQSLTGPLPRSPFPGNTLSLFPPNLPRLRTSTHIGSRCRNPA